MPQERRGPPAGLEDFFMADRRAQHAGRGVGHKRQRENLHASLSRDDCLGYR